MESRKVLRRGSYRWPWWRRKEVRFEQVQGVDLSTGHTTRDSLYLFVSSALYGVTLRSLYNTCGTQEFVSIRHYAASNYRLVAPPENV